MEKIHEIQKPIEPSVQEIMAEAGEHFIPDEDKLIAAEDSGHKVEIGELNGQTVAVKPFLGSTREQKADNEFLVTHNVEVEGLRTVEPLRRLDVRQKRAALFISRYIPDLLGAHTIGLEEDPFTNRGDAVGSAISDITRTLGDLHSRLITHGDAQPKNFQFSTKDVFDGRPLKPLMIDFEKGKSHSSAFSDEFIYGATNDVIWLGNNLGLRRFGGVDNDFADEVIRERVVETYLHTHGAELLGKNETSDLVDLTIDAFHQGRAGQRLDVTRKPPKVLA